jgi:hypothetical protein
VIRGIGLFFITTIVGLVGYIFGQIDWAQPESDVLNNVQQKTLNWGNVFNSTYVNVFIMVNIVLGLMLLDMYLRRRRETAMKKFSN